ncbi:MAG: acylphosphatase [Gemmatimonadetes bacterium]|nr:acylphosphatase [Gemmatimonadota bacterium]
MSDERRIRFLVHGRVQGVGFRFWVLRQAQALGLRGWVRNCRDGSVEVEAAGPSPALERLGLALRDGPPHAQVLELQVEAAHGDPLPDAFEIR